VAVRQGKVMAATFHPESPTTRECIALSSTWSAMGMERTLGALRALNSPVL